MWFSLNFSFPFSLLPRPNSLPHPLVAHVSVLPNQDPYDQTLHSHYPAVEQLLLQLSLFPVPFNTKILKLFFQSFLVLQKVFISYIKVQSLLQLLFAGKRKMLMSKNIIFFISLPFINWDVRMGSSSHSPYFGNRSISCYVPQPKLCIMSKRGLQVTNIVFLFPTFSGLKPHKIFSSLFSVTSKVFIVL